MSAVRTFASNGSANGAQKQDELPFNLEHEEALLSCCMIDEGETITQTMGAGATPRSFYRPAHAAIFSALCTIVREGKPPHTHTVAPLLKDRGELEMVGGIPGIMQVSGLIPTTVKASFYIASVRDHARQRDLIFTLRRAVERLVTARSEETGELSDELVREIQSTVDAQSRARSVPLADLVRPDASSLAKINLLGNGWLRRGQTGLMPGPTGIGKSSFTMQGAITWSVGRSFFQISPQRPLRVLICQAENDEPDVTEMRDGIVGSLQLNASEMSLYNENVRIVRTFKTGPLWLGEMEPEVRLHRPDLVIVDPLFAFAGVDLAKDQPGLTAFLRGLLLPFSIKHNLGFLLVHHTNKPPGSSKDRPNWQAGDHAYSGSGHGELANFCRFVASLRSLGSRSVFEFRIGKRWQRAGLLDQYGGPTDRLLVKHGCSGIYWEPATDRELQETVEIPSEAKQAGRATPGSPKSQDEGAKFCAAFFRKQKEGKVPLSEIARKLGISEKTIRRRFDGNLFRVGEDRFYLSNGIITHLVEEHQTVSELR